MTVLFLGSNDWANLSHGVAEALRAVGVDARVWVLNAHAFGYDQDLVGLGALESVRALAPFEALVHIGDGDYGRYDAMKDMLEVGDVPEVTQHCGSYYRAHHARVNAEDARRGFALRFLSPDSLRFAPNDPRVRPIINSHRGLLPLPMGLHDPVTVAHSPSTRAKKGTDEVLRAFDDLPMRLELIEGVSHSECLRRRAACSVFVDQLAPTIGGYGQSAVEAMAQGCAVLGDVRHVPLWLDEDTPRPPILEVHHADDVRQVLLRLHRSPGLLYAVRETTLAWSDRVSSPVAVGTRWKRALASVQ